MDVALEPCTPACYSEIAFSISSGAVLSRWHVLSCCLGYDVKTTAAIAVITAAASTTTTVVVAAATTTTAAAPTVMPMLRNVAPHSV